MEYTEHYVGMLERNSHCEIASNKGFHMLHDDFDEDWGTGDEPHGTLTFTDVPSQYIPVDEPATFKRLNPVEGVELRLNHVEEFLEERYSK